MGNGLIQLSGGLGASNQSNLRPSKTFLANSVPLHDLLLNRAMLMYLFGSVEAVQLSTGLLKLIETGGDVPHLNDFFRIAPSLFTRLNRQLEDLLTRTGPRYLELALDDSERFEFVVVQSAPVTPLEVKAPDPAGKIVGMDPVFVLGTKVVDSAMVRYNLGPLPDSGQYNFNQKNPGGYVLVASLGKCTQFASWGLEFISNATAIVLDVKDVLNPVASHLGGLFRELGIPVLVGSN
ncbi:MAG: hypothetical protein HZC29_07540 [Thaumarchaeota archaeon]|nr:hypothetical protein [Nitrososphaerota archaeon]